MVVFLGIFFTFGQVRLGYVSYSAVKSPLGYFKLNCKMRGVEFVLESRQYSGKHWKIDYLIDLQIDNSINNRFIFLWIYF